MVVISSQAEAESLLEISEKLLQKHDLNGSKNIAISAQEKDPLLKGTRQILAIVDVLLASQKRTGDTHDWYGILQLDCRPEDIETINRQYRRLALLLHPDKNKFAFADSAFQLVTDAWKILSHGLKKSVSDPEADLYAKVDLVAPRNQRDQPQQQNKLPTGWITATGSGIKIDGAGASCSVETSSKTFWTVCPYCYRIYEYPSLYEECCMRCQNCNRAFHAVAIPPASLPSVVSGKEEYYCSWVFFPVGYRVSNSGSGGGGENQTFQVPPNSASTPGAPAPADGGQDGSFC